VPIDSRTKALADPELEGVNPEDYPDIHKMAILADVAPYSREYNTYRQKVGRQAQDNTELEIEYERILNRVKRTRESVIRMQDRHFTAPVDEISGTVDEVSPGGITLKEFPGRQFQFSSVSTRDFRPLPGFGAIERNYRKRGAYSDISLYMNRLHRIMIGRLYRIYATAPARPRSPHPKLRHMTPAYLKTAPLRPLHPGLFPSFPGQRL
jgi:hypothetical protein